MKYLNNKDRKKRIFSSQIEVEKIRLKSIFIDKRLPIYLRFLILQKIFLFSKQRNFNKIKNRCIFTNNPRSVYRDFLLNRSSLREFLSKDLLPGLRKSSW